MEWLDHFREVLRDLAPWAETLKNAFAILGAVFGLIIFPVARWIRKMILRIAAVRVQRDAAEDELALVGPSEPAESGASPENWEKVRARWQEARERVEEKIGALHGTARRAYDRSRLPRHNYDEIARKLRNDRRISGEAEVALRELDQMALGLRRARATTKAKADRAEELYAILDRELP